MLFKDPLLLHSNNSQGMAKGSQTADGILGKSPSLPSHSPPTSNPILCKASQSILLVSPFIEPLLSFPNQSCPYLLAPEPFSPARLSCKCILPVLVPYLLCLLSHTCAHPSFMKHRLLLPFRFASQLSTFPPSAMLTHPLILAPMYWSAPKPSPQNSPLTSLTS